MFSGSCSPIRHFGLLVSAAVLFLLVPLQPAYAQADAWSVEVAVADRSDQEQEAAYGVALRRVLLANSGDKTLLNRDDVRDGLRNAESYVEEFRYRTPSPGTVISRDAALTEKVRTTGQATQLMLVRFDRKRVRELIDSAPSDADESSIDRPFTRIESALVWMLIEDEDREIFISDDAAEKVRERMRELAGAAGVSLAFPVGDEEDLEALRLDGVPVDEEKDLEALPLDSLKNPTAQQIRLASERYGQPFTLVGYLKRNGPLGWKGQWMRLDDSVSTPPVEAPAPTADGSVAEPLADPTVEQTEFTSGRLDEALQTGLAWLAPSAGSASTEYRYGGANGSDTEMLIAVSSVNSTRGYAEVVSFLSEVEGVNGVYPKEVSDDIMVLSVYPKSAIRNITDAVDRQDWLRRTAAILEPPGASQFGRGNTQPAAGTRTSDLARDVELTIDLLR